MSDKESQGQDDPNEAPAYNPFLKHGDVTAAPGEDFDIQPGFTRRKPGRFGEQIIAEVVRKRDGKVFDFAFGVGSQNHRILARRLGDERVWGGTIKLKTMTKAGARAPFIAIVDTEPIPF